MRTKLVISLMLCVSVANAQNATVASKSAIFLTRVANNPPKLATIGAFKLLFGGVTFIPAAIVGLALKNHAAAHSGNPDSKGVVAEASTGLAFATVAGAMFAAMSGILWANGIADFADAVASDLWNPSASESAVVKTPLLVTSP